mmetsp:Transcript_1153/g.2989  ORF Transcript_1153/g.2989 Transcript_1153/m.2989 type:complete len:130 (+) Transcript_1153:59-448(+)
MAVVCATTVIAARPRPRNVPGGNRHEAYEEQEKFWKSLEQETRFNELKRLLHHYDVDKSGNLDAAELSSLIQCYSNSRQWTREPVQPTVDEISWILQAAGKHKRDVIDLSGAAVRAGPVALVRVQPRPD